MHQPATAVHTHAQRLRPHPTAAQDRLAAPQFPLVYAMRFTGPATREFRDGDLLAINTMDAPKIGDMVCVHLRAGHAVMMTLGLSIAPHDRMPWTPRHADEPVPVIAGRDLYGAAVQLLATEVWAVHVCDGKYEPEPIAQAA